jgi:hypothetical protein
MAKTLRARLTNKRRRRAMRREGMAPPRRTPLDTGLDPNALPLGLHVTKSTRTR